jgi:hypothetical protein
MAGPRVACSAMPAGTDANDLLTFSGVDGSTGAYLLPPLRPAVVAALAQGERVDPMEVRELRARWSRTAPSFGTVEGVDPLDLAEAGWGVIFAHDADPAVREALEPLLDHRRRQASRIDEVRYRTFAGADGYRPGDTSADFLVRHGVGPGQPADPRRMPYYLLLVGGPEAIPYPFQYRLDVVYAVGRLDLETPEAYERYAWSVIQAESADAPPPRATFFGARHPHDRPTQLSTDHLVTPLARAAASQVGAGAVERIAGEGATKASLSHLLRGNGGPGLLFVAGHGMGFPLGDPRQRAHQGALLCQDWPGPRAWSGPIPQDFYFAGDDVGNEARLGGLVVVVHACFGAGTPRMDSFLRHALDVPAQVAPHAFVGRLPQRLLGHSGGGVLAVVGHVDRAWSYSFLWPGVGEQTQAYQSMARVLLGGGTIGRAVEYLNDRCAALTTDLDDEKEAVAYGRAPDALRLSMLWTARNDARNLVVLGDPAIRIRRHQYPYQASTPEGTMH